MQEHGLVGAGHIPHDGFTQRGIVRQRRLRKEHVVLRDGPPLGFHEPLPVLLEQQDAVVGPRILDHDAQKLAKHLRHIHFPGEGLAGFLNGGEIQGSGRHGVFGAVRRRGGLLPGAWLGRPAPHLLLAQQLRVGFLQVFQLSRGAPAIIEVVGLAHIAFSGIGESPAQMKLRRQFIGQLGNTVVQPEAACQTVWPVPPPSGIADAES